MPGLDKGDAVRIILAEIGPQVPVAYLGDDITDEGAFLALGTRGLTALVRPEWRKTAAALWMRPPEGLRDFLTRWLQACREGQHHLGQGRLVLNDCVPAVPAVLFQAFLCLRTDGVCGSSKPHSVVPMHLSELRKNRPKKLLDHWSRTLILAFCLATKHFLCREL
jgi:hypothetical protein